MNYIYKKTLCYIASFLLLSSTLFAASVQPPFWDGFESPNYSLGNSVTNAGWWQLSPNAVGNVTNSPAENNYSCDLSSGGLHLDIDTASGDYTNVWVQIFAKNVIYNDSLSQPNISDNLSGAFYINHQSILKAYVKYSATSNGWTNVCNNISTNDWTGLALHIDYINQAYDFYTNSTYGDSFTKANSSFLPFQTNAPAVEFTQMIITNSGLIDAVAVTRYNTPITDSSTPQNLITYKIVPAMTSLWGIAGHHYGNGEIANNTLTGELGNDLLAVFSDDDKIKIFTTNGWNTYKVNAGTWIVDPIDDGQDIDTVHINNGTGMFVTRSGTNDSIYFSLYDSYNTVTNNVFGKTHPVMNGWNLFVWPLDTTPQAITGFGFTPVADWGDRLYVLYNGRYKRFWWDGVNSCWTYARDTTTNTLSQGTPFWYYKSAGSDTNWVVSP